MGQQVGVRVYPDAATNDLRMPDGGYGRNSDGTWLVRPPGAHTGALDGHAVTEHEDGTITVSPSIDGEGFHGHLINGVWTW